MSMKKNASAAATAALALMFALAGSASALTTGTVQNPECTAWEAAASNYVNPADGTALQSALNAAVAGDLIELSADTTYSQTSANFVLSGRNGTSGSKIVVCGPSTAVVQGVLTTASNFRVASSSYVVLTGFTVDGGDHGVKVDASSHNEVLGLTVQNTEEKGIWLVNDASSNVVSENRITAMGLTDPDRGHGIAVGGGTAPDDADNNLVEKNMIEGGPEASVSLSGAASGNTIRLNEMDKTAVALHSGTTTAFVEVAASSNTVEYNQARLSGFKSDGTLSAVAGFSATGTGNTFRENTGYMNSSGTRFSLVAGNTLESDDFGRGFLASEGYATTQGSNQWRYETFNGSTFAESGLSHNNDSSHGDHWNDGASSDAVWIGPDHMAPSVSLDAVRVWVAPYAGEATISGVAYRKELFGCQDNPAGSGHPSDPTNHADVAIEVRKGTSTVIHGPITMGVDPAQGEAVGLRVTVATGDKLRFIVKKQDHSDWGDWIEWDPLVILR